MHEDHVASGNVIYHVFQTTHCSHEVIPGKDRKPSQLNSYLDFFDLRYIRHGLSVLSHAGDESLNRVFDVL